MWILNCDPGALKLRKLHATWTNLFRFSIFIAKSEPWVHAQNVHQIHMVTTGLHESRLYGELVCHPVVFEHVQTHIQKMLDVLAYSLRLTVAKTFNHTFHNVFQCKSQTGQVMPRWVLKNIRKTSGAYMFCCRTLLVLKKHKSNPRKSCEKTEKKLRKGAKCCE